MRTRSVVVALATGLLISACGSSSSNSNFQSPAGQPVSGTNASAVSTSPAINVIQLTTGSDQSRITATIKAFYRAAWENQGAAACSLFSPDGEKGFMTASHIAFPGSVNSTTKCSQAMAIYAASLSDQVSTLQDDGVAVQGDALNDVGVADIKITGSTATAEAPEDVGVLITPKLIHLVESNGRWLIGASTKIGKTLPQILASKTKKTSH